MQRINLLYVITKLELGGAQNQVLSLIKHLDQSKFRLFLFTAQDGLLIPEAEAIKGLTLRKSRCLERPINPLRDFLALIAIYRFIKKNNIRIVHTHSSKAGILGRMAAKLAKVGVIIHTVHGWSFNDYQPGLVRWFYIWLERIIAQFTDSIIVVSSHDKQQGIANRIGADNKYSIIHYGIDYAQFSVKGQGIREELGISASDLMVCMVSCFKPQKSPQDFIRLASLINESFPNAKFLLVGDGILRDKIERLIHRLNLQGRVILAGWRRDIPQILSDADVFALTSLWEGLPISVLEAMASSLPVVATDTIGIREVILEGKTGFLVSPRDMNKMSEKLSVLLKDKGLRVRMGENARQGLGGDFYLKNMARNTQDLYDSLIKNGGGLYAN